MSKMTREYLHLECIDKTTRKTDTDTIDVIDKLKTGRIFCPELRMILDGDNNLLFSKEVQ